MYSGIIILSSVQEMATTNEETKGPFYIGEVLGNSTSSALKTEYYCQTENNKIV